MTENTLEDVDHTHPDTDRSFGEHLNNRRGPAPVRTTDAESERDMETPDTVSPDGGRTDETDTLADVSHHAEEGVQSVYERGPK